MLKMIENARPKCPSPLSGLAKSAQRGALLKISELFLEFSGRDAPYFGGSHDASGVLRLRV